MSTINNLNDDHEPVAPAAFFMTTGDVIQRSANDNRQPLALQVKRRIIEGLVISLVALGTYYILQLS